MQHAAVREAARRTVHSSRPDSGTARRHIEPPIRHSPAVAGGVRPFDQSGLSDHRSGNVTLHEGLATSSCKKGSTSDAHVEVDLTGRPNRLVRVARVNRPSGTRSCLRRADQSNCRNARHKASQAGMMHGERSWATPATVVVRRGLWAGGAPHLHPAWPDYLAPGRTSPSPEHLFALSAFLGERNWARRQFWPKFGQMLAEVRPADTP